MSKSHPWRRHAGHLAWPTLLLAAAVLLGEAAVWVACLTDALPLWAGAVLATVLGYVAFTPLHDASHGAVGGAAKREWLDKLVGTAMGFVILAPFPVFRSIHLKHHGATNDPDRDPDYWVAGGNAASTAARCMTIMGHYYVVFFQRVLRGDPAMKKALGPGLVGLGLTALTLAGLVAAGLALPMLALWVGPALVASALLAFFFDYVPHHPHDVQGRHVDTRVILIPGLSVPMLAQNYHLVHHLYPRVPFYRYAALFREIEDEVVERGAPIVRWPRRAVSA